MANTRNFGILITSCPFQHQFIHRNLIEVVRGNLSNRIYDFSELKKSRLLPPHPSFLELGEANWYGDMPGAMESKAFEANE